MLSMSEEQQGYHPVLYQFKLEHDQIYDNPVPDRILLTFYLPEKKRLSKLVGIVIIGGQPDIYSAYYATKILTPHLESYLISEHESVTSVQSLIIEETLKRLSSPIKVKPILQILETSERKKGDKLSTFFPILASKEYHKEKFALPSDFQVDAAFVFEINEEFFKTTEIGGGLETLTLYARDQGENTITGNFAIPLIIKWQPIYNDILTQLKKSQSPALPTNYKGKIKPDIIIFNQEKNDSLTALISTVTLVDSKKYYNIAVARSGYSNGGKPLSFIISALSRQKFGEETWVRRMVEQNFSEDAVFINWQKMIDTVELKTEDKFDLGIIRTLKNKVI